MKKQKKARPGDEQIIHDETQDWVERSSALARLAADGHSDIEVVARGWLRSEEPELAIEALDLLISYCFARPRAHEYLATAMEWLGTAEDQLTRSAAARNLSSYMRMRQQVEDDLLRALLKALEHDESHIVRAACYKALLEQVDPEQAHAFRRSPADLHAGKLDIRWDLLEPLRARLRNLN